ncbi:MAG: M16 family metallopeptidase, partial [Pyrinomonadaceae bacterium]
MKTTVGSAQLTTVGDSDWAPSPARQVRLCPHRHFSRIFALSLVLFGYGTQVALAFEPRIEERTKLSRSAIAAGGVQQPAPKVDPAPLDAERRAAAQVTEFEVNGLKVLMKQRTGNLTVAAGLFLRGGSRNITSENAGIESLMLDVATEASANYPRDRMRNELSRMGTVIGSSENYDYSVLSVTSTRPNLDRSWQIFTDVVLRPAFTKDDFELVKSRRVSALRDDTDDPDTYLQRLQERVAYAGHP